MTFTNATATLLDQFSRPPAQRPREAGSVVGDQAPHTVGVEQFAAHITSRERSAANGACLPGNE
jgi:hypothetical protein